MKTIVFFLLPKENIWAYENILLQAIKDQRWKLTINNKHQICESIYDAINILAKRGFNSTFRLSKEIENESS